MDRKSWFVSEDLIEREVSMPDGKVTVYVRELSDAEFQAFIRAERSKDEKVVAKARSEFIAASIMEADGSPVFDVETAGKLKTVAAAELVRVVLDLILGVSDQGKGLRLVASNGSSAPSHSDSAKPSKNSKRAPPAEASPAAS